MIGALDFYFTSFRRLRRRRGVFFIYTTERLVSGFSFFIFFVYLFVWLSLLKFF